MDAVFASLGALLVRAVPTFLLLIFLHFYLKAVFFGPLGKALKERSDATTGLRKLADEAIANAGRKAAEYDEKLREARGEIYKEQEAMRRQWREEQAAAVAALRKSTGEGVAEKRRAIEEEKDAQRTALASRADALAEQIAQSVLGGDA